VRPQPAAYTATIVTAFAVSRFGLADRWPLSAQECPGLPGFEDLPGK